jgi:nitroimidazol reductase NimA-like FMN-containing flavoprotein (pyridoxamine 5'-phosphate oxidase superfamily)
VTDSDLDALLAVQQSSYARAGEGLRRSWPEAQALDREGLLGLLQELVYGVLATSRPDGRAHAAPVAYSVDGGAFWVASVEGRRLRNLRTIPWASLVLFDRQPGGLHRALTAEGRVRLWEGDDFAAVRRRLDPAWTSRHEKAPDWAVALVELRPERIFSYGGPDA